MEEITRKEEQILLAVHTLKDNAYLITIREQIKNYTGKYYSVGTIYAPLNRLDINGFLHAKLVKTETGKPIKYYTITPKGYSALEEMRQMSREMWKNYSSPAFE